MSADMIPLLTKALGETVYMVVVSMIIATIIGVPLGVLLHTTSKGQILESLAVNRIVGAIVNAVRSIPFIILLVAIIPFTRLLVGSAIGTTAAMVPLVIAAIPFIGRQVETSLKEVPFGLVEAAQSMGATPAQIIWKVLLPESMSSIVAQLTTVIISLVGESAMAGAVGGGGLGDLAIRYGYQRFRPEIMLATVAQFHCGTLLAIHSVLRQICHHLPQHVLVGTNSDVVLYVAAEPYIGVHGAHAAEERLETYVGNDSLLELRYLAITVHKDVQRSAGVVYGSDTLLQRCALDGRAAHVSLADA